MKELEDLKKFLPYYNNKKRIFILSVLFLVLLVSLIFIDMRYNPYPPQISFIQNNRYVKGDIYFDNEYIGGIEGAVFTNLPAEYCKGTHILTLYTGEDSFTWETDPAHCTSNLVKFEVRG